MKPGIRKVLVVDDNRLYREAIQRNLEFVDYVVYDAEDLKSALEVIRQKHPQVVITDLDMSHRTEGLDLIREVKRRHPQIPVILVSAVGTFEEGAAARELGATAVISKSRIDQELEHLYSCLDDVFDKIRSLNILKNRVDKILEEYNPTEAATLEEELNQATLSTKYDTSIKVEIFDLLSTLKERAYAYRSESGSSPQETTPGVDWEHENIQEIESLFGPLRDYDPETQTMLIAADKLSRQVDPETDSGLARNIGFSYSFAVENEIKRKMERRFAKFISSAELKKILPRLYDSNLDNLSLGLSQYLLRNQGIINEITQDLVRQILERMKKHGDKYKADGLKALGVITYLFGRDHTFEDMGEKVVTRNPLGLKGLTEDEVTLLSILLIRLQHIRNPFIHPEFSEREKLSEMQKLVADCLKVIKKILD